MARAVVGSTFMVATMPGRSPRSSNVAIANRSQGPVTEATYLIPRGRPLSRSFAITSGLASGTKTYASCSATYASCSATSASFRIGSVPSVVDAKRVVRRKGVGRVTRGREWEQPVGRDGDLDLTSRDPRELIQESPRLGRRNLIALLLVQPQGRLD